MLQIEVICGNIAATESDAIITAVNSGPADPGVTPAKAWVGGVDAAIKACAGNYFHDQVLELAARGQLVDGAAALTGFIPGTTPPHTPFRNVIFVIDDLLRPLRDTILRGLRMTQYDAAIRHVTLPLLHTGVLGMLSQQRGEDPLVELAVALREFISDPVANIERITVVVYGDVRLAGELSRVLAGTY